MNWNELNSLSIRHKMNLNKLNWTIASLFVLYRLCNATKMNWLALTYFSSVQFSSVQFVRLYNCASLSTQHVRPSLGFSGRWSDGLELTAARRTQRSGVWCRQLQTVLWNNLVQLLLAWLSALEVNFKAIRSINLRFPYLLTYLLTYSLAATELEIQFSPVQFSSNLCTRLKSLTAWMESWSAVHKSQQTHSPSLTTQQNSQSLDC